MANPLFDAMGKNGQPQNGIGGMISAFQQFKAAFSGNPEEQVQQLLNSGQMTQAQYNQLAQMASGLMKVLK